MNDSVPNPPATNTKAVIDEAAQKARAVMTEILTLSFDKSMAYTNLIMLGGYGGAFTLWSYTRDQMSPKGSATVAILLAISLIVFVSFEVYKMINSSRAALKQRALIMQALPSEQFLTRLQALRIDLATNQLKYLMPIWCGSLVVAISTVIGSAALLFYSFFATLLGWPQWP